MSKKFLYGLGIFFLALAFLEAILVDYIRPEYRYDPWYIKDPFLAGLLVLGIGLSIFAATKKNS